MGEYSDYHLSSADYYHDDEEDADCRAMSHPMEFADNNEWYTKEKEYIDLRTIGASYAKNIAAFIDRSPRSFLYDRQRDFIKNYWKV